MGKLQNCLSVACYRLIWYYLLHRWEFTFHRPLKGKGSVVARSIAFEEKLYVGNPRIQVDECGEATMRHGFWNCIELSSVVRSLYALPLKILMAIGVCQASFGYAGSVSGWRQLSEAQVHPMGDNKPAKIVSPGCFRMSADLSRLKIPKVGWDFHVSMDMRRQCGIEFDFYCSDVSQVSSFVLYLKSGEGWYYAKFVPKEDSKWRRIVLKKSSFTGTEGKVAGWENISAMRISGLRCGRSKVELGIGNLGFMDFEDPQICIVRGDSCMMAEKHPLERFNFGKFSANTANAFETVGMSVMEVSDLELESDDLRGVRLLVLPYNPALPEKAFKVISDFVAGGGAVFACYSLDAATRRLLEIDEGWYRRRNWKSSSETPIRIKKGFFLAHVWRYGHDESIRQAANLLVQVCPEWKNTIDSAVRRIEEKKSTEEKWVAEQSSKKGEWRAFWCHSERGLGAGHDWDSSIKLLKENGFNTILPNLAWAGVAFYPSSVVPVHSSVSTKGDALNECMNACRKYGVKCHVWKVCWRGGLKSDKSFFKRLSEEGRIQVDEHGKQRELWMCPSNPKNLKVEIDTFVELARKRPDGIHMDYIRYPDDKHCFCKGCKDRFEKTIGRKLDNWPKDVTGRGSVLSEAWQKFRSDNITALVRGVSERVRMECPGVEISAAVFQGYDTGAKSVAQDWVQWCKKGYLDFVCPMNYYVSSDLFFEKLVRSQNMAIRGGSTKLRPGLGLSCWRDDISDAVTMARQIKSVRDIGLDGFAVFALDERAQKVLPVLRKGPVK